MIEWMYGPSDAGNATEVTSTYAWPALMEPWNSLFAPLNRDKAIKEPVTSDRMPNDAAARSNCLMDAFLYSVKNILRTRFSEVGVLCGVGRTPAMDKSG